MNLTEGQSLPTFRVAPVTPEELRAYAKASGDENPIHTDEAMAKGAGFPSVIVHGMLSMAYLGDYVFSHFPESEFELKNFKVRFRKVILTGVPLTCDGVVRANRGSEVVVFVSLKNSDGESVTDGEAVLAAR